jgi:hypothetical protein
MRTSPRRLIALWSNLNGVTEAIGHAKALATALMRSLRCAQLRLKGGDHGEIVT